MSEGQEAILHEIEHIRNMLKEIGPNVSNISIGQLTAAEGWRRLVVNIPVDLKDSTFDVKLRSTIGRDAHLRYLHGVKVDAPGYVPRRTGFAGERIRPLHLGLRIGGHEQSEGYTVQAD
jgi:hypothetical protein